jgi:NO-binding membrane sensor protein with MHYT domain
MSSRRPETALSLPFRWARTPFRWASDAVNPWLRGARRDGTVTKIEIALSRAPELHNQVRGAASFRILHNVCVITLIRSVPENAEAGVRIDSAGTHGSLGDEMAQVQVHNFSHGLLNPGLGYLMSCLGSFLGLRCLTRARAYTGWTRAIWLLIASVAIGATGIWAMHFIAMLGFAIPGQQILYNVPITLLSLLVAIIVVAAGLFIVGYGGGGLPPVLAGGVIIGLGVATMHYVGMSAMNMPGTVRYNMLLVAVSVIIAIVAGTAALLAGLHVGGVWSTIGVSLVMGVAVSGMHYTGMAAMRVFPGGRTMTMSGSSPNSFLFPLLLGASVLTFLLALIIAMSPNEEEILADASLSERLRIGAESHVRSEYDASELSDDSELDPGQRYLSAETTPGESIDAGS